MVYSSKFKIGEEVYLIFKENNEVIVRKDKIKEICITEDEVSYILEDYGGGRTKEDELVGINYTFTLTDKIVELFN